MRTKAEFSKLTIKELEAEISQRQSLLQQMVGSLYPSILQDELFELRQLLTELRYPRKETP